MEERRKQTQITVESVDQKLGLAIKERLKLAKTVDDLNKIVHFDGGLVYKCDLTDFGIGNTKDHEDIKKQLKSLLPLAALADEKTIQYLKEGVELKKSVDTIQNSVLKNKTLKIIVFITGIIGTIIGLYLTIKYEIRK